MKSDTPPTIHLTDYTPPAFLIDHVDMVVRLDGPSTKVRATYAMRRNAAVAGTHALRLDAEEQDKARLWISGVEVEPLRDAASLTVTETPNGPFELAVETLLHPAGNRALSGLYLTNGVYCTQCEAEGFRRILPFLDRPDVLATYTVRLEARREACPVLLSNGNPVSTEDLDDGWHAVTWHDPHPKPSYLFALVGRQARQSE